jgi:hypothetical protein
MIIMTPFKIILEKNQNLHSIHNTVPLLENDTFAIKQKLLYFILELTETQFLSNIEINTVVLLIVCSPDCYFYLICPVCRCYEMKV